MTKLLRSSGQFALGSTLVVVSFLAVQVPEFLVAKRMVSLHDMLPDDRIVVYLTSGCSGSQAVWEDLEANPLLADRLLPISFGGGRGDPFDRSVCAKQLSLIGTWWVSLVPEELACAAIEEGARDELDGMDGVVAFWPSFAVDGKILRSFDDQALSVHGISRTRDPDGTFHWIVSP